MTERVEESEAEDPEHGVGEHTPRPKYLNLWRSPDGKVRSLWRIAVFVLVFATLTAFFVLPIELLNAHRPMPTLLTLFLQQCAFVIALILATAVMLRYVERRNWSMVLMHRDALDRRQLFRGTALGVVPVAVASLLLLLVGWITRVPATDGNWTTAALAVTVFLIPAAFSEELLARGYAFAVIREASGALPAILLTGLVFGVLHGRNPGANYQSIAVVTLAGVFLAVLLLATGSLYAATLAHAGWNWVMAVPLHTPVSGLPLPAPDYRIVDAGPDWATGGSWGPEAGVPAALAMILLMVYMLRSRGNKYPLIFSSRVHPTQAGAHVHTGDTNG